MYYVFTGNPFDIRQKERAKQNLERGIFGNYGIEFLLHEKNHEIYINSFTHRLLIYYCHRYNFLLINNKLISFENGT